MVLIQPRARLSREGRAGARAFRLAFVVQTLVLFNNGCSGFQYDQVQFTDNSAGDSGLPYRMPCYGLAPRKGAYELTNRESWLSFP